MAGTKISALTTLTGANAAAADIIPIVDTSAVETKSITVPELGSALLLQTGLKTVRAQLMQQARDIFGGQVNCFDRCQALVNPTGSAGTKFTSTSRVHKWRYHHKAQVDCGDFRWVFANVVLKPLSGSAQGEDSVGNAITVAVEAVTAGSVTMEPTFYGNQWVRLEDFKLTGSPLRGIFAISDPIGGGIDEGDAMQCKYSVMVDTIGDFIPTGLVTASATLTEGTAAGDLQASANSGGGAAGFHPFAILGTPIKGTIYSFCGVGDSIMQGSGGSTTGGIPSYGWWEIGLSEYPRMRTLGGGAKYAIFDTASVPELFALPGLMGTHAATVFSLGTNDIASGTSLANIKAYQLQGIREAIRNGAKRIIVCTIPPYTDTKVNWTTLDGQVPGANGTAVAITNVTNATPAVCTAAGHGLSNGQYIYVSNCGNVTPGFYYVGGVAGNDFALYTDSGLTAAYTSSGTFSSTHSQFAPVAATLAETIRRSFNTYCRDGSLATAVAAIDPTIPVSIWDICSVIETNSAGTLTTNGGYWQASYTADGIHPNDTAIALIATYAQGLADALDAGAY